MQLRFLKRGSFQPPAASEYRAWITAYPETVHLALAGAFQILAVVLENNAIDRTRGRFPGVIRHVLEFMWVRASRTRSA